MECLLSATSYNDDDRAQWRLSWAERLTRNARAPTAGLVTIYLFGVPDAFARFLDLATA